MVLFPDLITVFFNNLAKKEGRHITSPSTFSSPSQPANSTHVLNIISPVFTCSFSLAKEILDEVITNNVSKSNNLVHYKI